MGPKDRELKVALQKQERYQQSVQSVTAKMEQAHSRLTGKVPMTSSDLDKQLKDYTVSEQQQLANKQAILKSSIPTGRAFVSLFFTFSQWNL